jgi:hypothetical protein
MATNADARGVSPPYGPWSAFTSFMRELNASAVPPSIDGTLFKGKSGSAQSQIRGALRFFELVEDDGATTDELRKLVAASADPDTWKAAVQELLSGSAYLEILKGVDLEAGTLGQLQEAFRERGGTVGSVNRKAIRFYLNAATDAGYELSPHFGQGRASPGTRGNGRRSSAKPRPKKTPAAPDESGDSGTQQQEGVERVACSIPGGRTITVTLPTGLKPGEEDFVVRYLQDYFKLKREA